MNIVSTSQLCKKYGNAMRVKQVGLEIPEGMIYGFLGPNGAGKTTTLKMLTGLIHPTCGTVTLFGQQMNTKNRLTLLKQVGSFIESPSFYGHLTGAENLRVIQILRDVPAAQIAQVLDIVRLTEQQHRRAGQYSLGMKQRLGLAGALLGFPKLLILDEPTNGLDPAGIQEMRELICSLPKQLGMTVLISSHLLSEIDQMASYVGIIREGELVFQDTLAALHEHSQQCLALRTMEQEKTMKLLDAHKIPCKLQEDYLLLPFLSDLDTAELIRFLAAQGINLLRIEERKKSLEDIFLQLTGGKAASL